MAIAAAGPVSARVVPGAIVGALCGFMTYWSGATVAAVPDLMRTPMDQLPHLMARPFQTYTYWEIVLVAVAAFLGILVARYRWRGVGVAAYVGLVSMIAGFVVYCLTVSIPQVPPHARWLSYTLLAAETGGLGLIVVFSFYSLDAATRRRWTRLAATSPWDPDLRPKVALIVPCFNEPVDMLEQTVAHLVAQDYPRDHFVVVVVDDSTDEEARQQLAAFCAKVGAQHVTRADRRGFKAGAINHVTRMLDPDIELIAVIDADYWVHTDYLKAIVGYFVDPSLSFVQTPQDYRNINESFLTRRYKRAEAYFYHSIMPSRNEESAIIFCGTMGMLRRSALQQVGGFAEDQICEDAEISVRLAVHGWRSLYVDHSFGKGLMPAVFDAYKKQFHRWAFGNVRIFLSRTGMILRSRMTKRQKFHFLVSNLHWFDGIFVTTIALILLYLGISPIIGHDVVTHHQREIALLGLVPLALLVDSVIRLHLVLGRAGRTGLRETLMVQGMWFAIKFTNLVAVLKCLLGFRTPFVRTPKHPGHRLTVPRAFLRALRLTKMESLIGLALLAVAAYNAQPARLTAGGHANYLLPAWLTLYATFFLTAPLYAYLSYRTLEPLDFQPLGASGPVTTLDLTVRAAPAARGAVSAGSTSAASPTGVPIDV